MLKVIGAGLPRTATHSLKLGLERLLGGTCYHMAEVFTRPEHVPVWKRATEGDLPDWDAFFEGFTAAVDFPPSAFWRELSEAYPKAPVVLSVREDADAWWRSVDRTVAEITRREPPPDMQPWLEMVIGLMRRTDNDWSDPDAAKRGYERHNAAVREAFAGDGRLVEWLPSDGWAPLCAALGVPVPDEPFPVTNTTAEFRSRWGWD
jgi:hypothetical protein